MIALSANYGANTGGFITYSIIFNNNIYKFVKQNLKIHNMILLIL